MREGPECILHNPEISTVNTAGISAVKTACSSAVNAAYVSTANTSVAHTVIPLGTFHAQ